MKKGFPSGSLPKTFSLNSRPTGYHPVGLKFILKVFGRGFGRKPFFRKVSPDNTYKRLHEPSELLSAYSLAAGKKLRRLPPPIDSFKTIVTKKIVSVGSKIDSIVSSLKKRKKRKLFDIYKEAKSRSDLVASFLAILELAKNKAIYISGDGDDAQIEILEGMENS